MDRSSIETAHKYEQLRRKHFNGGYYSEEVRKQAEVLNQLDEKSKIEFYTDVFEYAWSYAQEIMADPRYDSEDELIDFTEQGLGKIFIEASHTEKDENVDTGYRGVYAYPADFAPESGSIMEWNSDADPLGLESPPDLVPKHFPPRGWSEQIFLYDDGRPGYDGMPVDEQIMRALDMLETLKVAKSVL